MKKILIFCTILLFSCEVEQIIKVSLIKVTPGLFGDCTDGGVKIETGIDKNNNDELEQIEITSTSYVCHGKEGLNSLVNIIAVNTGEQCANGGFKIETGIDLDSNKVLEGDEIQLTKYICNGEDGINGGADGADGADGEKGEKGDDGNDGADGADGEDGNDGADGLSSLINITEEVSGDNCPDGGLKIVVGIDDNNNQILDDIEIDSTNYICNLEDKSINTFYDIEMLASGGQSLNLGGGASNSSSDWKNSLTFPGGSSFHQKAYGNNSDYSSVTKRNNFFGSGFVTMEANDNRVDNNDRLDNWPVENYPPVTAALNTILSLLETENQIDVSTTNYQMMPFTWGKNGTSISSLNSTSADYQEFLRAVRKAKEFADAEGKTFGVRSMNWHHGEADLISTANHVYKTKEWYYNRMTKLFTDVNNDVKEITKQEEDLIFFTYQTSPIGWENGYESEALNVQDAQLQVAIDNDNVYMAGAMYQYYYPEGTNLPNYRDVHPSDRAVVSLQTSIAMKRVLFDQREWPIFRPISHHITNDGSNYLIHLKFDAPSKPIRFDISGRDYHNHWGKVDNYGFQILNNSDDVQVQVAEPYISGDDTVVFTVATNPEGLHISYAVTGNKGGGNLCDSQNITIVNKGQDYLIDNFAVAFLNYPITPQSSPE